MSDEKKNQEKIDVAATQPIKKTSAVPLRKETVRVTLKAPGAKPGGAPAGVEPAAAPAAPAPTLKLGSAVGQAPKPLAAAPTIPLNKPMTPPAPSVPLKQETMRVTLKADKDGKPAGPPAPSAPKAPAPAAKAPSAPSAPSAPKSPAPAPAPTIPLNAAPPAATPAPTMKLGGAPTVPLATQPLKAPLPGASQPLPKATVELQQTQQLTQGLGAPSQAPTIHTVQEGEEAQRGGSGIALPLSIVAFVLSLVVLYFQFSHSKIWIDKHKGGDIMSLFSSED